MIVDRIINHPVPSNTFVLGSDGYDTCVVIDPGSKDSEDLINFISSRYKGVEAIILTHSHFDHSWGAKALQNVFNAKIFSSDNCAKRLSVPQNYFNLSYFNDPTLYSVDEDVVIVDSGQFCKLIGQIFHFVYTPGHTDCSMCIGVDNMLFSGDTIMNGFKPVLKKRYNASIECLKQSVFLIQKHYEEHTMVYPGHGEPFELHEIREQYATL